MNDAIKEGMTYEGFKTGSIGAHYAEQARQQMTNTPPIANVGDLNRAAEEQAMTTTEPTTCPTCNNPYTSEHHWQQTCATTWSTPEVLHDHTSEDTAYLVDDYPYGFTARTQIRYWIETQPKRGQRFVSQTMNPKTGKWNKPKKSTYQDIMVLILDDKGHVSNTGMHTWPTECEIQRVEKMLGDHASDYHRSAIKTARLYNAASKKITYEVRTPQPGEKRQTADDVRRVWSAALGQASREMNQ